MKSLITLLVSLFSLSLFANENISRLGLGVTQEAANDLPAISFKVHFGEEGALGGFFGYQSGDASKYAFGAKYYHTMISEPNLILSINALGALINTGETTGFQASLNLGGEFLFEEFPHVGLSAEAGLSVVSMDSFTFQTNGLSIIKSALHFYF